MALNTTDFASGRLISELPTATTTGVTLQAARLNGSYVTFPTGEFFLYIKRSNETDTFVEKIKVASGSSQNSTTGVVTLGTLTRNISLTDGSDAAGTSATYIWPSGTLAYIGIGSEIAEMAVLTNQVNTMTAGSAIRSTSTTTAVVRHNSVTTAQRLAMSASNGDRVYDSDLGQHYKYEAGAWAAEATGTFSNAANGTAGKVDLATAAEVAAGTATDATSGAPNVIPVSIVKTSSAGAGDSGKLPALNTSGQLDISFLSNGVPTGAMFQWLTDTAPTGYLLCYGQAVSRTDYATLFGVISTTYGTGDGSTTFNLPDLRGRFPLGQDDMGGSSANRVTDTDADTLGGADGDEFVTLTTNEMPAHTHGLSPNVYTVLGGGASQLYVATNGAVTASEANDIDTDSAGSGAAHDNMPPFITVNYIIKT